MTESGRQTIQWCPDPQPLHFVIAQPNSIAVYNTNYHPISSFTAQHKPIITSFSWKPSGKQAMDHYIFAHSTIGGRIILQRFDLDDCSFKVARTFDWSGKINKVAFNPEPTFNQLAASSEKQRNGYSCSIWDIGQSTNDPVVRLWSKETVHTLEWLKSRPSCLIAGVGNSWIKIRDLRENADTTVGNHGRPIKEIALSNFNENIVASCSNDGVIKIWDIRQHQNHHSLEKLKLGDRRVSGMQWSHTRSNQLAVAFVLEKSLRLYDLSSSKHNFRTIPLRSDRMTCFAYHPTRPNRIISFSPMSDVIEHHWNENVAVNWSSNPNHGVSVVNYGELSSNIFDHGISSDISVVMYRRAISKYSVNPEHNCKLFEEELNEKLSTETKSLLSVWKWIGAAKQLISNSLSRNRSPMRRNNKKVGKKKTLSVGHFIGLLGLFRSEALAHNGSDREQKLQDTWGHHYYTSQSRSIALRLLWSNSEDIEYVSLLDERAAAILIWVGNLDSAIQCLLSTSHSWVAVALASYGRLPKNTDVWNQTYSSLISKVESPYLQALLSFIFDENFRLSDILCNEEICILDRIAFACRFLERKECTTFLKDCLNWCILEGRLEGLCITGYCDTELKLNEHDVMKSYLSNTHDIQTVALLGSYGFPLEKDSLNEYWFESYKLLLDQWKLWKLRAELDHDVNYLHAEFLVQKDSSDSNYSKGRQMNTYAKIRGLSEATPGMQVRCGYCSNPLTRSVFHIRSKLKKIDHGSGLLSNARIYSCFKCQKSLPRCSLCLLGLTCAQPPIAGSHVESKEVDSILDHSASSLIEDWMVWCQKCRHGGHCGHILNWFKSHSQCPVTNCTCECGEYL